MLLTENDQTLLNHLRVNSRSSVSELARKMGVSRTTIQDRLGHVRQFGINWMA